MINIILFALYIILSASGLILFKLGTLNPNIHLNILNLNFNFSIKSIIGMVCYMTSFLLWMLIVSRMNLTIAMPLSVAFVNTLVILGSIFILNEKITLLQGLGIFIVIIGVAIMTYGKN